MTTTTDTTTEVASSAGYDAGTAAGSWIIDGNTTEDTARRIRQGYDDGDPAIMDLCPAPLSGEWGGESVPELSHACGVDLSDDDNAEAFEQGFVDGFWDQVVTACTAVIGDI